MAIHSTELFRIAPTVSISAVALNVADLEGSLAFYEGVLGMRVLTKTEDSAELSFDGASEGLRLHRVEAGRRAPDAPGLYHFAILFANRLELAQALARLVKARWPLQGASDHLVSEAIYLADPEGNGIELYFDRPRDTWSYRNGEVAMSSERLDLRALLNEIPPGSAVQDEIPETTTIGHVHLRVTDLDKAQWFYVDVLGFDVSAHLPQALFVSAGGYHHHVGLNTWGMPPYRPEAEPGSLGLRYFELSLPDDRDYSATIRNIEQHGLVVRPEGNGWTAHDPFGIAVRIVQKSVHEH